MTNFNSIPGYLTLAEAEDPYGVKADTLKKRCQNGEIIGAKKVGKTWFVPNVPGIDPEKTIPENYPSLDFDAALESNLSLYDAESEAKVALYYSHKEAVYIWEHGFYFFSLIFRHTRLHRSYLPLASLVTEAHTALRSSFLLNLLGYHSDAIVLLRKTHECTIKALAMRTEPKKFWQTGFSKSREASEHKIGVDFKGPWSVASSFSHGNLIRLFEVGKDIQDKAKKVSVSYGPQINRRQFATAINTSIFWLFVLTKSLPYLFTGQIDDKWLSQKDQAAKLLKDYLTNNKAFNRELQSFEGALDKLKAKIDREEN